MFAFDMHLIRLINITYLT